MQALVAKNEGNEFYKKRQFEEALACYEKAFKLDPTDMTFLNNKAAVYFEQGNFDECIKQCEQAVEVGRENRNDFKIIAKAFSRMASAYQKKDDLKNALFYFQKSLTEHRTPETLSKMSAVEKELKDIERKAYIDPDKALEEKNLGNKLFQKGDYPGAIKHYTEAIKRNPEDAKIYSNRAACYQKLAEFYLALKDCEECIRLEPTFGKICFSFACYKLIKYLMMLFSFQHILVKGYIRKGYALMATKELSKAQSAFQKALELDENNKASYNHKVNQ